MFRVDLSDKYKKISSQLEQLTASTPDCQQSFDQSGVMLLHGRQKIPRNPYKCRRQHSRNRYKTDLHSPETHLRPAKQLNWSNWDWSPYISREVDTRESSVAGVEFPFISDFGKRFAGNIMSAFLWHPVQLFWAAMCQRFVSSERSFAGQSLCLL